MRRHDLRLAVPAAAGWALTAIVVGLPGWALPVAVAAWAGCAVLTLLAPRAALVALAIALCCTSVAAREGPRQPDWLQQAAAAHRTVEATVMLTETVVTGSQRFEGTAVDVDGAAVSVPVLVFVDSLAGPWGVGATLVVRGTLETAEPGDDRAFLVFARGWPELADGPPAQLAWADGLRAGLRAAATALPGDGGRLLPGLALGDTSAVTPQLDAALKVSSLSHLTAVSGANCAVVVGLVMLAGGALGAPRIARIAVSLAALTAFVVLVTPEPSVLRAAAMALLVLAALAAGRPVQGLPILALAVLALLVADPWLARSYGFVLSVLATGGLLVLAAPLATALQRWLPRWLSFVIAVPLAAQLACQPVIILLDAALPTYGVVANVLAEPAAPLATVIGLAACVALVVAPPLGELLCAVAWLPSAWIAGVGTFFSRAPAAQLPWPEGIAGVLLAAAFSAAVVLSLRFRWARAALAVVVVLYAGVAGGTRLGQQLNRPPDWQYAACDVGQGDAFLVRDAGEVMVIDTGPLPEPLGECLADLGIDRVDILVLTHWDRDHVGGAEAVLGRVDRVIVGPAYGDAGRLVARLVAGGAVVEQAGAGLAGSLGSLDWHVLWPPVRAGGVEPGNEASIVLRIDCESGCLSGVFLGDLGQSAQERLPPLPTVDVVKVAHHGSADQSAALYGGLRAAVGLIGVGVDNGYGHPAASLLGLLADAGTTVLRTDSNGLVLLSPGATPGAVSVWTER